MKLSKVAVTLAVGLALQGCGGGDDPPASSGTSTGPVAITAANQVQVTGAVLNAADIASSMQDFGDLTVTGGAVQPAGGNFDLGKFLQFSLRSAVSSTEVAQPVATGAETTFQVDCPSGGTMDIAYNDSGVLDEVDAADTFGVVLTSCVPEAGIVVDGSITITAPTVTGDWAALACPCDSEATFAVNVTVNEFGELFTLAGGATLVAATEDGISFTATLTGTSLSGLGDTLSNFTIELTNDDSSLAASFGFNGTIASPDFGGSVTVVGLTQPSFPFSWSGDANPDSGRMEIRGVGSCLEVTAVDSTNVQLQLHNNDTCTSPSGDPTLVLWDDL